MAKTMVVRELKRSEIKGNVELGNKEHKKRDYMGLVDSTPFRCNSNPVECCIFWFHHNSWLKVYRQWRLGFLIVSISMGLGTEYLKNKVEELWFFKRALCNFPIWLSCKRIINTDTGTFVFFKVSIKTELLRNLSS